MDGAMVASAPAGADAGLSEGALEAALAPLPDPERRRAPALLCTSPYTSPCTWPCT